MTLRNTLAGGMALVALLAAGAASAQAEASAAQPQQAAPARPTVASLTAELEAANATISAQSAQAARQAQALDNARADLKALRDATGLKDELLVLGRERNAALYKIGQEILTAYADVDLREALSRREPFVQAKRVQLENEVQAYEDRLRQARVLETTLPPSVERRMQEELTPAPASEAAPAAPAPQ